MMITAKHILGLLRQKHVRDVFVAECKDGSSWMAQHLRLDAWAMRRSWAPLTTFGYEIKVSRSDWTSDKRWSEYLPLCHRFSLVCPVGLIGAHELPADVGLVWAVGNRLHTKRAAAYRQPDSAKLCSLMAYVLMSRARIVRHMHDANVDPQVLRERIGQLEMEVAALRLRGAA